jgi:hypothetical protein
MGNRKKRMKGLAAVLLAASIAVQPWLAPEPVQAAAADAPVTMTAQEPLTYGAILKKYEWNFERNKKPVTVNANVVEVDLKNPYVKLDTIAGTGGQLAKKQSVRKMANETGAVAAINGDFFNTQAEGVPIGPQVSGGKLLATPPYLVGWYSFALTKENKPIIDMFTFQGKIVAKDGATYPLGGINKTYYWYENDGTHTEGEHSMIDGLYMYTNTWGQVNRSNDGVTVPTEILVQNGVVQKILRPGVLEMVAPTDGYILRASGKADEFVALHLKVGDRITADYKVLAQNPAVQYDAANFNTMIGGHTILVNEGQPAEFSHEVNGVSGYAPVARTAIGFSKNEQYAYLITIDSGLTLAELQQFMIKVGVWKGINLDGGGSTQMATRPLGEFQTALVSADIGYERPVVNSVGVYSLSPKGQVRDIQIQGATALFVGQKAIYSLKAYDDYFNPVAADQIPANWSTTQPIGTFQGNTFTAAAAGKTQLTVVSGKATKSIDVEVIGGKDVASLKLNASSTSLLANSVYTLSASVTSKSGAKGTIPAEALQLEFIGFKGRMEGSRLTIDSIDKAATEGRIIARYDGFSTMLTMPIVDNRTVESFETSTAVSFTSTAGVTGNVYKVSGIEGIAAGSRALGLQYDFSQGTGITAAYALFADGLKIDGQPESFSVKVKGDSSRNWVRAEIKDSAGKVQLISLTEFANWSDWKTLSADLKKYTFTYPIALTKLYVANPENGHDERELKGQIWFDDIFFQYQKAAVQTKNVVKLTIDQKSLTVNGKQLVLDQAPVIYKDNTLVPVRFVVEAMGGQLTWVDGERKVIIMKDNHLIELWLDKTELIADGEAVTAEVPPLLMTERTMVPLRVISEKMGWKVTWDEKARMVTLE